MHKKKLQLKISPCEIFTWKFIATDRDGNSFVDYGKVDMRRNCKLATQMLGLDGAVFKVYKRTDVDSTNSTIIRINSSDVVIYKKNNRISPTKCTRYKTYAGRDMTAFLYNIRAVDTNHILLEDESGEIRRYRKVNRDFNKVCVQEKN